MKVPQRWWLSSPFLLALASVAFLGWSVWLLVSKPYDGFSTDSGMKNVVEVDPVGPAAGKLIAGDTIVSVNGRPAEKAFPFYSGSHAGDLVQLIVKRDGGSRLVTFRLTDPSFEETVNRLFPVLVSLIFWIVGVSVLTFKTPDGAADLFFLFSQTTSVMLAAGAISSSGPSWTSNLFNALVWLMGPLTVHFHLWFPQVDPTPKRPAWLVPLYLLALTGALPNLVYDRLTLGTMAWFPTLRLASLLFLAANLLLVVILLIYNYRHAASAQARGKIRIVILGGMVSAVPVITLTIFPAALSDQPIIPFEYAFLLLGVIPLTYGYAIVRHRLIEIEKHVNRGATQVLVYSLIGGFYLLLNWALNQVLPDPLLEQQITTTILVLFLASIFMPLRKQVQIIVDRAFYGGWYDYRTAVMRINQGLEQITDLRLLANAICERTLKTLRLENIYLFLTGPRGDLSIFETYGYEEIIYQQAAAFPILPKNSVMLRYLQEAGGPVDAESLQKALAGTTLTAEDRHLLACDLIGLWVPIFGRKQISGVLALGPKLGGDLYNVDDLYILGVVARQIGPLIENIHLLTRLRQYAKELEKRVEERTAELHDAKERVEAILTSVGDGVFVTDLSGKIVRVNTAFLKQSHLRTQDIIGQDLFSLFQNNSDPENLRHLQQTLRKGDVWIGELVGQRRGGKLYDVQLTIAPIRDQRSRMVGYVGSQRDITQQRELDRLKDQFISDVSHELRTPVTNLNLFLGLLERARPEKRAEYLAIIKSETHQISELIEDILDLSRLEKRKTEVIEFEPVDLNAIAQKVVSAHRLLAQTSGVDLQFSPGAAVPPIYGVESQLSRLVTNLVSNAVRYTPEGHVRVRTFQDNSQVCLEVSDDGIGIDADDVPHLFERFFRGRKVSQSQIPGTGLGLAIVKEIADIHAGEVDIESQVNVGSTFTVRLPIQEAVAWQGKRS